MKYIVVVGSIMSGLGKGAVTASIAKLLKEAGHRVSIVKFDGYLNVDCGTMNPFRHGEVFVLEDGQEVDMDFGTYERFINKNLSKKSSITGGSLFKEIIDNERKGKYLGLDVQFIPHLTDEIKKRIRALAKEEKSDIVVIEVGGTAGDLENGYFLEAMRQLSVEEDVLFVQLSYAPILPNGEIKTKPTQQANKLLMGLGINPKIIIMRASKALGKEEKKKIALYCNIPEQNIIDDPDLEYIYDILPLLHEQRIYDVIAKELGLDKKEINIEEWINRLENLKNAKQEVRIAIVGKYVEIKDAYVSVKEAIMHAAAELQLKPKISYIDSETIEKQGPEVLKGYEAIIVPGGFGKRGIEGKIEAIRFARENKIPFLGLCLGMQLMAIEYARNVVGLSKANSSEFEETEHKIIDLLEEQKEIDKLGGTMRLGAYPTTLVKGTRAYEAYKQDIIYERHRHRYEFNNKYKELLEKHGLVFSGYWQDNERKIMEIIEWKDSFGIASQAHVELKSRFEKPAPLFLELLRAAKKQS